MPAAENKKAGEIFLSGLIAFTVLGYGNNYRIEPDPGRSSFPRTPVGVYGERQACKQSVYADPDVIDVPAIIHKTNVCLKPEPDDHLA